MTLRDAVARAFDRRAALHADAGLDCYRLVHGWTEGAPGLEVDRYGDTVVVEARAEAAALVEPLVEALDGHRRFDRVVVRLRGAGVPPPYALRGALPPDRLIVHEHGLRFAIEPGRAGNPGLYLDARSARAWIRAHAEGRRVLNLFAFTGSLGVAAAVGGARSVLHVDASPAVLAWCRDNHALNDRPIDGRDVAKMNVYQHLRKAAAGRQRFGAIIVDPPPGPEAPRVGDRTPGLRGPLALVPHAARMLEPGGWLLVFLHHGIRTADDGERDVIAAAATSGVTLAPTWRGTSGDDFPEPDPARKLTLVALTRA